MYDIACAYAISPGDSSNKRYIIIARFIFPFALSITLLVRRGFSPRRERREGKTRNEGKTRREQQGRERERQYA